MTVCDKCNFELFLPIRRMTTSWVGLYDDERYPGRCIVAYAAPASQGHPDHLEDLTDFERDLLMSDVIETARAIKLVTQCERVNYAALCNAVNHVHFHLIPRFGYDPLNDPFPERSPWNNPRPTWQLEPWYRNGLIYMINYALSDGEAYEF